MKVNEEKSSFGHTETNYLGFWVIRNGVRPLTSNVDTIKANEVPTKVRDVRWLVGLVNYYGDMWLKLAHTIPSLTKLCYVKVKFIWTKIDKKAFTETKKIVGRDVLISYPNSSEEFIIHTDSIKLQLRKINDPKW